MNTKYTVCYVSRGNNVTRGNNWTEDGAAMCRKLLGREWKEN
jgi:hypothetical protein